MCFCQLVHQVSNPQLVVKNASDLTSSPLPQSKSKGGNDAQKEHIATHVCVLSSLRTYILNTSDVNLLLFDSLLLFYNYNNIIQGFLQNNESVAVLLLLSGFQVYCKVRKLCCFSWCYCIPSQEYKSHVKAPHVYWSRFIIPCDVWTGLEGRSMRSNAVRGHRGLCCVLCSG